MQLTVHVSLLFVAFAGTGLAHPVLSGSLGLAEHAAPSIENGIPDPVVHVHRREAPIVEAEITDLIVDIVR